MFLEILKNSQENTCARVSSFEALTLFKKRLWHECFPVNFVKFLKAPFLQNSWTTASWNLSLPSYMDKKEKFTMFWILHVLKVKVLWNFLVTKATLHSCSFKRGVLKICSKFTGQNPCRSVISIKMQSSFIIIPLWHGCSPVSLLHILTTSSYKNTSGGLLFQCYIMNVISFTCWCNCVVLCVCVCVCVCMCVCVMGNVFLYAGIINPLLPIDTPLKTSENIWISGHKERPCVMKMKWNGSTYTEKQALI